MITLLFLPSIFSFSWSLIFSLCNLHDLHNLFSKIVICTYKVLALNMAYFSWLNMTRYFGLPLIPGFLTDIWHLESTDSTGNTKKRTWASHHMKSTWTSIQILEKGHRCLIVSRKIQGPLFKYLEKYMDLFSNTKKRTWTSFQLTFVPLAKF